MKESIKSTRNRRIVEGSGKQQHPVKFFSSLGAEFCSKYNREAIVE
jgi:signal recognition particle GTPase